MVQGWRRYSWKQLVGVENFEPNHFPEQAIEIHGQVISVSFSGKKVAKPNVNVDLLLHKRGEESRTLYWNPSVTPDETGAAGISFYNNSSCKNFSISAETITTNGTIGLYKN